MAPHHQSGRATDTRNDPTPKGRTSQFGCRGTLPRRQERSLSQPRPTTTRPPPRTGQEPHDDEPSWHRLLGTLLSSQGTDAHPARSHDPPGGNRSILPEIIAAQFRSSRSVSDRSPDTTYQAPEAPGVLAGVGRLRGPATAADHLWSFSVSVPPCRATTCRLRSAGSDRQIAGQSRSCAGPDGPLACDDTRRGCGGNVVRPARPRPQECVCLAAGPPTDRGAGLPGPEQHPRRRP